MVAGWFTRERSLSVSLDRMWKAGIIAGHDLIPELLPDVISSIDVLEGDGGVGTVERCNFSEAVGDFEYIKYRVDEMDDENYVVKYHVYEGGLVGQTVEFYSTRIQFQEDGEDETIGNITVEYDTLDDNLLSEEEQEEIVQGTLTILNAIEAHLLENPSFYA